MSDYHELLDTQLQSLLIKAAEVGARRALIGAGLETPTISWNQAVKRFGQGAMLSWTKSGRIKPIQQGMGATHKYSVTELVALALTEERHSYLSSQERRAK